MASSQEHTNPYPYATPDEPRDISDEDLAYLSRYTGEKDLDKLRAQVITVWKSVKSKLWVYKCIQRFMFLQPRIIKHSFYHAALQMLRQEENPAFLDIGCCFGQDTRQVILDGVLAASITATDISPDYWDLGRDLFMDKATLKVQCAFGSFTDPGFISTSPPAGPLSHLVGKVTVAWSGAVLHVLSAEDVRAFAKHVHAVLAPGGVWFGDCVGSEPPGDWAQTPDGKGKRYLHSPSSLQSLLQSVGFTEIDISGSIVKESITCVDMDQPGSQKLMLSYTAKK